MTIRNIVKNELIQRSLLATRLSINAADIARRTKKEVSSTTEETETEAKHIEEEMEQTKTKAEETRVEEEMEKTRVEIEAKLIEEEREKARADASKEEAEKTRLVKVSGKIQFIVKFHLKEETFISFMYIALLIADDYSKYSQE